MKIIDLGNEVSVARLVDPAAIVATAALGVSIDLQGYQGKVKIIGNFGAITGTTPTLDTKIQDSADNATFADLATPLAFTQKLPANANSVDSIVVDTRGVRRYLRLYGTAGGTTPSFTAAFSLVGQKQTI